MLRRAAHPSEVDAIAVGYYEHIGAVVIGTTASACITDSDLPLMTYNIR